MLRPLPFALAPALLALGLVALAGCTAPGLILTATGIATDTSMTWDIVKHVHAKLTEDDPTPCLMLNSVRRAVNPRCDFVAGSIRRDARDAGRAEAPMTRAEDAVLLDTTELTIEAAFDEALRIVEQARRRWLRSQDRG